MDILVLGGAGMLGHKLFQHLRRLHPETCCTIRGTVNEARFQNAHPFQAGNVIENVDASKFSSLEQILRQVRPKTLINCIGVIKQRHDAKRPLTAIEINALLPHKLAQLCETWGGRLIHFSTDCVFSGKRGNYAEEDISDAEDLYGRTKFLGEVAAGNTLTVRTSIIGRELGHRESLLEWFLAKNHQRVSGFTEAMYSGVTTNYMARVVEYLIANSSALVGLYQVTSPTISKFDLLCLLRDAYRLEIDIAPDPTVLCDRSMKGDKFLKATGLVCPRWPELVMELANDDTPYEKWK